MQRTKRQPLAAAMIAGALAATPLAMAQDASDGTTFGPATPGSSSSAGASATSGADFGPAPPSAAAGASDFGPLPPSTATEGSAIGSASRTESPNETFTSSTMVGSGVTAADQALMNRLVGALANDPQLKDAMITVQVDGGRVALSGLAQDETQAARAREVAEGIAGAGSVTGSLDTRG